MQLLTIFVTVNLNHFRLLRVVGKGAFGKVRIVERKDTGLIFALKYIRKDEGMGTLTMMMRVAGMGQMLTLGTFSGTVGKREKYHPRETDVGTT